VVVSQAFDAGGYRTALEVLAPGGGALARYTVAYDRIGNPRSVLELDGRQTSYTYDAAYQLTGEARTGSRGYATSYVYDANGNRVTRVGNGLTTQYTYDPADQLLSVANTRSAPGPEEPNWITLGAYPFLYQHPWWRGDRLPQEPRAVAFAYDESGNRLLARTPWGRATTYTWDCRDHLTEVLLPTGARLTSSYRTEGLRHTWADQHGIAMLTWAQSDTPLLAVTGEGSGTAPAEGLRASRQSCLAV
jgi:YD repeat-containing protein